MRMDAYRGKYVFVISRQFSRGRASAQIRADIDDIFNPRLSCPGNDLLALGVKIREIQMGVGVNQHLLIQRDRLSPPLRKGQSGEKAGRPFLSGMRRIVPGLFGWPRA